MDWLSKASCRDFDPDLWFPEQHAGGRDGGASRAKEICAGCPVLRECALDQLNRGGLFGIRAGVALTQPGARHELAIRAGVAAPRKKPIPESCGWCRRAMRRKNEPASAAPGTVKHRRNGLCETCFRARESGRASGRSTVVS